MRTDATLEPGAAPAACSAPNAATTCAHCALHVPAALIEPDADAQFCCHGCRTVYGMLHANGLENYYRLRASLDPDGAVPVKPLETKYDATEDGDRFGVFDAPAFDARYVQRDGEHRAHADLRLENVRCAACLWLIERLPRLCPGVIESRLSLRRAVVRVTWDPTRVALSEVARRLERLGYPARPDGAAADEQTAARRVELRRHWVRIGIAGACAGNAMLLAIALYAGVFDGMEPAYRALFRGLSAVIGLIALAGPGAVFFRGAWAALRARTANLDLPIALALGVGGVAGLVNTVTGRGELYFDSLCVLVFLLLVGRYVQYRQQRWAEDTIGLLMSLTPLSCRRVTGDDECERVPVEALRVGDVVEVRSGEPLPADGVVTRGASEVEQAMLTGEAVATAVGVGDRVFAGTNNTAATLRVRVTQTGKDTRVAGLMRLVHDGVEHKPPVVQLTDRLAGWFVVVVSAVALAVFAAWWWVGGELGAAVEHTVALLIVACPCALALATPLTLAVAAGRAAKRDILIKRAAVLETLAGGGRVWFDKTGTLTHGYTRVAEWFGPAWLRGVVGDLEAESTHPIGRVLAEHFGGEEPDAADRARLGHRTERGDGGVSARLGDQALLVGSPRFVQRAGVTLDAAWSERITAHEAAGRTAVVVALDGSPAALVALGDAVRDEACDVVEDCRGHGWTPALLSGDAPAVASHVAAAVGIAPANAVGGVSPEDKLDTLRRSAGPSVMVGDGVNDAAALAVADVGVAVSGGAEAALAAADVYLARDGIAALPALLALARRTLRVIRLNLVVSLTYNATAVTLAAAGLITPLLAAILMPISSALALGVAVGGVSAGSLRPATAPPHPIGGPPPCP